MLQYYFTVDLACMMVEYVLLFGLCHGKLLRAWYWSRHNRQAHTNFIYTSLDHIL